MEHTRFTEAIPTFPGKPPTEAEKRIIEQIIAFCEPKNESKVPYRNSVQCRIISTGSFRKRP